MLTIAAVVAAAPSNYSYCRKRDRAVGVGPPLPDGTGQAFGTVHAAPI